MRLDQPRLADHDKLLDVGAEDHHLQAETWTVQINATTIPSGTYEHRISLSGSGHKIAHGILRGWPSVDIRGHAGCSVVGSDNSAESMSMGLVSYGSGYLTSYMGAYSRLHGDTRLSIPGVFGPSIALADFYIDDDELVLEFYNTYGSNRPLTCYGSGVVK